MLITGGSGFLGRWMVRLARKGWDVTATYLTNQVEEPDIDWRRLNVRDEATVSALIEDVRPAAVIHTAALNPGRGSAFEAVNAVGTQNVARAAGRMGTRLIHVSTDVLFDGEKGKYVEEDRPSPITPYGRSKALAEEAVRRSDVQAVIVRTSLIYGAAAKTKRASLRDTRWQDWDRQTRWVIGDLKARKPVHLFTDEKRCPIWVESLAAALVELARSRYQGTLHVAGAQPLSRYAFGVRLARFHGVAAERIMPALSRESGLTRPLDCTLDCSRAQAILRTPLPGVDQVLRQGRAEAIAQS